MSSAICFNLDKSKILSSCNELKPKTHSSLWDSAFFIYLLKKSRNISWGKFYIEADYFKWYLFAKIKLTLSQTSPDFYVSAIQVF